ncbi:uncharacterized protein LOC124380435 [Silurus meridionalis]|uniref:HTH CENPB-type domain-containing protein n=1 Tax=Silurus meridionalis TaxID=175797 RepID=A0A8T0A8C0_SILME|nr:uncharacterized protein LOC124380435 [Silurus meridionalis]KAF7687405.1 hypothetical protein HF521_014633 [Silurus meridionalis]KAI5088310.1 hypothetical protein C0J45_21853 [Silurus meridionalis]
MSSGNTSSGKRRFTIEDKRRILELYDQLPRMSQRKAAKKLNVAPTMLWTLIHNRSCVLKGEKINREKNRWVGYGRSPRLEANIWKWIDQMSLEGTPITDLMVHRKSMEIAARMGITSFRPSPRWYSGFKKREAIVRERYRVYPEVDLDHQPDEAGSHDVIAPCSVSPPPLVEPPEEPSVDGTLEERVLDTTETKHLSVENSPTIFVSHVNGNMQTVTVPSLNQMQEAMKTLATGLLYRGFCDFNLLHRFQKEVANVVKRSMAQGCQDGFVA